VVMKAERRRNAGARLFFHQWPPLGGDSPRRSSESRITQVAVGSGEKAVRDGRAPIRSRRALASGRRGRFQRSRTSKMKSLIPAISNRAVRRAPPSADRAPRNLYPAWPARPSRSPARALVRPRPSTPRPLSPRAGPGPFPP
jgi:hypothetical protein